MGKKRTVNEKGQQIFGRKQAMRSVIISLAEQMKLNKFL